jgi:DNA replication and repair protein RecF
VIKSVELYNYRNYDRRKVELKPGINAVIGDNGLGKTNLLEALFFLLEGRSPRGVEAKEVIRWGEENAAVEGLLDVGRESWARINIGSDGVKRKGETERKMGAVCFQPDDVWMLKGGPEARRKQLDELIARIKKGYKETLREYQRILRQRNEAIREARRGRGDNIESWDPLLVRAAGEIVGARKEFLERLEGAMGEIAARWGLSEVAIRYYSTMGGEDWEEREALEKLRRAKEVEIRRGSTLLGPHRDEMIFSLGGRNVRRDCSQGEQKITAVMWRLAQGTLYAESKGVGVILLMDDCLSELDGANRGRILEEMKRWEQVVITATDDSEELGGAERIYLGRSRE